MSEDNFDRLFAQLTENINLVRDEKFMARLKKTISTPEHFYRLAEVYEGVSVMLERLISGGEEN